MPARCGTTARIVAGMQGDAEAWEHGRIGWLASMRDKRCGRIIGCAHEERPGADSARGPHLRLAPPGPGGAGRGRTRPGRGRARRAASSPPRLRGEWGWLGVGRAWYRPRRDDHAASTHQARLLASRRPSTGRMARVGRERGGTPLVLDRWRPCRLRIDHGRRSAPRQPALGKHQG